ncbi:urease accessory protein [Frankia sp. EI5c]|uniref:urease accessory protein UreF n=1 Tax=Frankia sp. EI5c TaxID=683316 RepID=UPI0007C2E369|nr:urease accessory UreF family protein [Frankia sp. EI5c]OAA26201.1 urease accessory protein [Frankia sp. EI5c]
MSTQLNTQLDARRPATGHPETSAARAAPAAGAARAALLLLSDSRLPAGGHAHSGGVEAAVLGGHITGLTDLADFLRGRLATSGLLAAAFAAAVCRAVRLAERTRTDTPLAEILAAFDEEVDARTPSPAQRAASRAQGRALLRVARAAWPVHSPPSPPHHCVALGLAAAAAGLEPHDAALAAAHVAVNGPATAAVRLLGLDPLAVTGVLARLAPAVDDTAAEADAAAADAAALGVAAGLPAGSAPHLDLLAERHRTAEVRMFTS